MTNITDAVKDYIIDLFFRQCGRTCLKTCSDENVEEAVLFVDGIGGLEAVMKIYSLAGEDWYYHLVTPFAYG